MRRASLLLTALAAAAAGCGSPASPGDEAPRRVAVVVLENQGPRAVLGGGWSARAARRGARAIAAYGEVHPSLGNYLAMISGSTQGVADDDVTRGPFEAPTIVGELERARLSWRAYMNAMPEPCFGLGDDADERGRYAKRHNPFLFFTEVTGDRALCREHVVPGERLAADLRHGPPRFAWITPDLCQDMHDCPVAAGRRWMARALPPLIDALGPRGVLVITADEGTGDVRGGGRIPMVLLGGGVRPGAVLDEPVDHRSLLATIEDALGLPRLPTTRGVRTLGPLLRP